MGEHFGKDTTGRVCRVGFHIRGGRIRKGGG